MKIYQASMEDLQGVASLFNEYRMFYRQDSNIEEAEQFLHERLEQNESIIFVAVEDGKYVGFTQLYPSFSSISMKELWILNDLFVQKDVRGAGIGKQLLKAAEQFALETDAKGLKLQTEVDNVTAQRLYVENGYIRDSRYFHYELNL
ncbi:GNAT family N-acetyltransferase [Bacillus sp. 3103sda1]|uniref:GNAT family N-acetyltransferase n=1 Tax=unclassified Bacillus (in: firmicutes) TaxID=185979 RepID=UPI00209D3EEB|nr:GNAT family N-acetyltransferase [Bacillus sp. 3103sda1]MCP1123592.1 GNAT family N-acetyltransferase [Bacillus sp. 3103sda1]